MPTSSRIPEIDGLRVLALLLMILYHFIYDLDAYTWTPVQVNSWFWFIVGKTAAILFIFLSGVSAGLSRNPVRNGLKLLFWGYIITFITYLVIPVEYVRFGILHFLGTMLLFYPVLKNRSTRFLLLYSILAALGIFFFPHRYAGHSWFLPLGLTYPGFSSIDYYPLFPYSGISTLGVIFYRRFYASKATNQTFAYRRFWPAKSSPLIEKMSRNSLLIYLVHQPVLLFSLWVFQKLRR